MVSLSAIACWLMKLQLWWVIVQDVNNWWSILGVLVGLLLNFEQWCLMVRVNVMNYCLSSKLSPFPIEGCSLYLSSNDCATTWLLIISVDCCLSFCPLEVTSFILVIESTLYFPFYFLSSVVYTNMVVSKSKFPDCSLPLFIRYSSILLIPSQIW